MDPVDRTGAPDADRRAFLKTAGRAAAVVPPAMTLLLTTGMDSPALAQSGAFAPAPPPPAPHISGPQEARVQEPQPQTPSGAEEARPALAEAGEGGSFGDALGAVGGGVVGLLAFLGL